ncbi:MAG: hypothetical protein D6736_14680 [Nitrospinota bacterium]|nr:MAG: hypothetical protein D6736_14680 [Nitrospinota bacterium]
MLGSVETGGAIYRSGAQVGDEIWVTGTLGDAYAGLRVLQEEREEREAWEEKLIQHYLQPVPRVREALWLRSTGFIHSMIDLSDGLSSDLGHICQESRVGVRVEAAALPLSEETRRLAARRGEDPLEYALHGGEDFELCFTASPGTIGPLVAQFRTRFALPLSRIGEVGPAAEPVLIKAGQEVPLTPQGYDHFRKKRD